MARLTLSERQQIVEVLVRRSNEIAGFCDTYTRQDPHYGSVELALTREIRRLRQLAAKIEQPALHREDDS